MILGEVCAAIHNYFVYEHDILIDDYSVVNGKLNPAVDIPTQYYNIVGSRLNDGVHMKDDILTNEAEFHGAVWIMSPHKDFLDKVVEIEAWIEKYGSADSPAKSPYQSESFGGYSYSKGSKGGSAGGSAITWRDQYLDELKNRWGRIRTI